MGRVDEYWADEEGHGEGGVTCAREPLRDFGTGLAVRVCDETGIQRPIIQHWETNGTERRLDGTPIHNQIWETAWRFFCDACKRDVREQWFSGQFFPGTVSGKMDPATGQVNSVFCSFAINPPTNNVFRVMVAGPLDNLSVALARSGLGH